MHFYCLQNVPSDLFVYVWYLLCRISNLKPYSAFLCVCVCVCASVCVLKKPRPTRCETRERERKKQRNCVITSHSLIPPSTFGYWLQQQDSTDLVCAFSLLPSSCVSMAIVHSYQICQCLYLTFSFFTVSICVAVCVRCARPFDRTRTHIHMHIGVSCIFIQYSSSRVEFFFVVSNMLSFHFSMGCSSACILYGRLQLLLSLPLP